MTSVVESCEQPQLLVNTNITREILEEIQQIRSELKQLTELDLGEGWQFPAFSCKEIAERKPNSSSGFYWLQNCQCASSSPVLVYCDLEKSFSTGAKGWVRVAKLNMTDPNQQCPPNFRLYTQPKRLCGKSTDDNGCVSVKFATNGLQYNKICGRVVGYQFGSPDIFKPDRSIDDVYVDGVSITHGNPRKHIWTLAAAVVETVSDNHCPCNSPGVGKQPPSFVGSDYYCKSRLHSGQWASALY